MKRFVNTFFSVTLAAFMTLSMSGCVEYLNEPDESFTAESAVSISETTETTPPTTETELAETMQTEKETAVPAELEGDYLQWAQTAADTVYRFLKEDRYYANALLINRFGFADLTFDDVPEIIFFDGGQWGGEMAAYTLDGDILYNYSTVFDNYESYIAAVESETGVKTMLFEAKGGHGFEASHLVFALTDGVPMFKEEWQYGNDGELYSYYAKVYSGTDILEESDNGDELYKKYFGKYEELYRFDSKTEMIEVPDSENYSLEDVYACVSQVMKKYSENLSKTSETKLTETAAPPETTTEKTTVTETTAEKLSVEKDGSYTTPEDVAEYIHTFGTLPNNFITKAEAKELGWDNKKGNLRDVAEGKSIGGDYFGNYEGLLPKAKGRKYTECDVNYEGGYRGSERIIFSNDGLIYYTNDHYQTFTQLY